MARTIVKAKVVSGGGSSMAKAKPDAKPAVTKASRVTKQKNIKQETKMKQEIKVKQELKVKIENVEQKKKKMSVRETLDAQKMQEQWIIEASRFSDLVKAILQENYPGQNILMTPQAMRCLQEHAEFMIESLFKRAHKMMKIQSSKRNQLMLTDMKLALV